MIVAVRQGNLLATAFHPELTADTRWYTYLLLAISPNLTLQEVLNIFLCRHSYFLKMATETEGASSSVVAVGADLDLNQPTKIDLPVFL